MKTLLTRTLGLALALSCASVLACDPTAAKADGHAGHAMDHGKMASKSPAERQQAMDGMFASIDTDKDGSLSRAEFDAHHASMKAGHHEMKAEHAGH